MKLDSLGFIQNLLQYNEPVTVFHPHSPVLVPTVIGAVSDSFYKISSEALLVLESLVKVIRPLDSPDNPASEHQKYVTQVWREKNMICKQERLDKYFPCSSFS